VLLPADGQLALHPHRAGVEVRAFHRASIGVGPSDSCEPQSRRQS
jgi:hypothetical protein